MKRARPPDDLNGIERPHKAKRSKPSFARPPDLGPITAILPELRRVLYQYMDTQSLGRLASTCRGLAKDMMTAPAGCIWLPAAWRRAIRRLVWPRNAKLITHMVQNVLRPRRFFERVSNAAAQCRVDEDWDAVAFSGRGDSVWCLNTFRRSSDEEVDDWIKRQASRAAERKARALARKKARSTELKK